MHQLIRKSIYNSLKGTEKPATKVTVLVVSTNPYMALNKADAIDSKH